MPTKIIGNDDDDDAAARRALLNRFAYEIPEDEEGGEVGAAAKKDHEVDRPISNKEAAQQVEKEKLQELRSHKTGTTKREEQQKTADARKNKQQLKEERRKRAVKGERKR